MPLFRSNFIRSRKSAASFFAASPLGNTKSKTTSPRKARRAYSRENHRRRASTPDPPPSSFNQAQFTAFSPPWPHSASAPILPSLPPSTLAPRPPPVLRQFFCNEKSIFCSQKYTPNLGPRCHTLIRNLQKTLRKSRKRTDV